MQSIAKVNEINCGKKEDVEKEVFERKKSILLWFYVIDYVIDVILK